MKYLHVIDGLGRGGAESLLINSIQLSPADEHVVVCLSNLYDFDPALKKLFTHYTVTVNNKLRIPGAVFRIRKIINRHKPDLIHAHLPLSGIITKLAAPKHIPLFYSIHSQYSFCYFNKNRLLKLMEKFTARPNHHLIGVSKTAVDDYVQYITNSGTTDVLYNFAAGNFFNAQQGEIYKPGQTLRCMAVGHLKYEKNYEYMLAQMAMLKKFPVALDIYGDGVDADKLKKMKTNLQLSAVEFKGKAANVDELMKQYHVFISCSASEGFGIAPVEAMAARLPVIVSSIPVFKELIEGVGLFVQVNDGEPGESLNSVIEKIVTGEINIANNIMPAFNRAKQIAWPGDYIQKLKSIYEKYL